MKKILLILLFILLVPAVAFSQEYVVKKVLDGDRFQASSGEVIKLIGIDAPESKANKKAKNLAKRRNKNIKQIVSVGKESAFFLKKLIEGRKVFLVFDEKRESSTGELLAYVYMQYPELVNLEDISGYYATFFEGHIVIFVNATMIESGYASPLSVPPNTRYSELFRRLFIDAKANKRGLWEE